MFGLKVVAKHRVLVSFLKVVQENMTGNYGPQTHFRELKERVDPLLKHGVEMRNVHKYVRGNTSSTIVYGH